MLLEENATELDDAPDQAEPASRVTAGDQHRRLADVVDVVVAIASNDFQKRAEVGDGSELLDGLALGVNMLAEEIGKRHARESEYQERLLQKERLIAIGQLAAGVAHEVNNPAAFVLANLTAAARELERLGDLLAPGASAADLGEARELLDQLRGSTRDNIEGVERVVSIVRHLECFSSAKSDAFTCLELEEVANEACSLVRAQVEYRAELAVSHEPGLRVRGDSMRLVQVLANLLHNAAQAIPEGAKDHHRVTVRTSVEGAHAVVTVRDTGTGLTEEARARMFEPFFTTKPRKHGSGLGLAMSADIVRHHGGELRLVSTSSAGTTFEVRLPLVPAAPRAERPTPEVEPKARPRVLIIDDEAMLLVAYERLFRRHFDLTLLDGGRAAIECLSRGEDFDAILCDVMMTDLDGVAVHDWIVAHRPALLERTFFCTGGAFTARSSAFTEMLRDRVLQKPLALKQLQSTIERVRR